MSNNNIRAITDDINHILWFGVGTSSNPYGLDKFDGASWWNYNVSNSGLQDNHVWNLITDANGALWISYLSNSGLTKFDGQNWTTYNILNSNILSNAISDIQIDEKNNLWLLCETGLSKFDGQTFTNYPINFNINYGAPGFVIEDSANIWIATRGLMHYNPITDSITVYDETNSNIPSFYTDCIGLDTTGLVWLGFNFGFNGGLGGGGTNGGLATFDGTTFNAIWPFSSAYTGVYDLHIGQDNKVWVATRCDGLFVFDGLSWTQIPEIPSTSCSFNVFVDRNGYTWYSSIMGIVGTSGLWTNSPIVNIIETERNVRMSLSPVPAMRALSINFISNLSNNLMDFTIFNFIGQCVYRHSEKLMTGREKVIDVSNFPPGLYFLNVRTENLTMSEKFLITR